jgi:hypothetical protein
VVQVTVEQPPMTVQVGHVSATPFCRYRPDTHAPHCWVVALAQVSCPTAHPVIAVHGEHT